FLLYGNRQVGKTYTVLEFGKCEYKSVSYFNSDNNEELLNILKKEKIINKLIMHLGILNGETIYKNDTLIVIDNVSNNDIIKSIKAFK
ncbi:MAG: AAA family ATPase, partial [Bacilli bacterium]